MFLRKINAEEAHIAASTTPDILINLDVIVDNILKCVKTEARCGVFGLRIRCNPILAQISDNIADSLRAFGYRVVVNDYSVIDIGWGAEKPQLGTYAFKTYITAKFASLAYHLTPYHTAFNYIMAWISVEAKRGQYMVDFDFSFGERELSARTIAKLEKKLEELYYKVRVDSDGIVVYW